MPSYPASLSSVSFGSSSSLRSYDGDAGSSAADNRNTAVRIKKLKQAVEFLHEENPLLEAAELGDYEKLEKILSNGTDIQHRDYLGRNALHFAVCSGNARSIILLLEAGVDSQVKDNVGMTPLSLCLMRSPSMRVANLLFDHGARLLPRSDPMDIGLFMQFVMMCIPTIEEENILGLLVEKGARVNDPDAPGGRQPLHFAAMSNNCNLIRVLLSLGADLYATNHRNETPREFAMIYKCYEACSLLEELEQASTQSSLCT